MYLKLNCYLSFRLRNIHILLEVVRIFGGDTDRSVAGVFFKKLT